MLQICVMHDSYLNSLEKESIQEGLQEFQAIFPEIRIANFGSKAWCKGDYSSADWYLSKTIIMDPGKILQIDTKILLDLLANEPWQQIPHIDIFITSFDLATENLNFCLGATLKRCTVQSVYRYAGLLPKLRSIAIKTAIQHELGHIIGMASDLNHSNIEKNGKTHCTNPCCIMRKSNSIRELVSIAKEARENGKIYCEQCLAEAKKRPHGRTPHKPA